MSKWHPRFLEVPTHLRVDCSFRILTKSKSEANDDSFDYLTAVIEINGASPASVSRILLMVLNRLFCYAHGNFVFVATWIRGLHVVEFMVCHGVASKHASPNSN